MVKQPREHRVPIMFAEAEIKSVDDWRFDSRVATRSDAVRKLAQIGIVSYREIDAILASVREAAAKTEAMNLALTESIVDDLGDAGIAQAVRDHFDELNRLVLQTNLQAIRLAEMFEFIQSTPDMSETIRETEAAQRAADDRRHQRLTAKTGGDK